MVLLRNKSPVEGWDQSVGQTVSCKTEGTHNLNHSGASVMWLIASQQSV